MKKIPPILLSPNKLEKITPMFRFFHLQNLKKVPILIRLFRTIRLFGILEYQTFSNVTSKIWCRLNNQLNWCLQINLWMHLQSLLSLKTRVNRASLHLSSIRLKKYCSMLFVRSLIWSQKTFCHRLSVQKFLWSWCDRRRRLHVSHR